VDVKKSEVGNYDRLHCKDLYSTSTEAGVKCSRPNMLTDELCAGIGADAKIHNLFVDIILINR
jgi:hypothetical protein